MALKAGDKLGSFEILQPIGTGGFGAVYKARDTRLNRTVAIKVLSELISSNAESRQRFEREAQTIARLKHPNICVLYDVGKQDGTDFLVMEYIEGETLAERLARGPLPLDQALKVAVEIADALDKAHRQGITHRDLKPGNIMLTKSGSKLLDFGLAKLKTPQNPDLHASMLPTGAGTPNATAQGTILGTLQYMPPEQLEGFEANARSDIFAFGAVLYEMLTGRKAFEGRSQSSLIASIMKEDPPAISALQPMTPPALERVVKTCLAKDPDRRWQSAADLCRELCWIADNKSKAGVAEPVAAHRRSRERAAWILAMVAVLAFLSMSVAYFREGPSTAVAATLRVSVNLPDGVEYNTVPIISPDGTRVVFAATDASGSERLWIRSLSSGDAKRIEATAGVSSTNSVFWSPDSRWIAFFANGKLKKVNVDGGSLQTLADASNAFGGTWSPNGVILFGPIYTEGPLFRVPADGGAPVAVTQTSSLNPFWPQFLPDGNHFIFYSMSSKIEERSLYVGSLDSDRLQRIPSILSMARYSPPGFLLFAAEDRLMAQRFDLQTLSLSGESVQIADRIANRMNNGAAYFSVSSNGLIAYHEGTDSNLQQMTWLDRTGQPVGTIGKPDTIVYFRLSRDQKRIALDRSDPVTGKRDIWLIDDLDSGIPLRLTSDVADNETPVWSPDGRTILFAKHAADGVKLYRKDSSGNGVEEPLRAVVRGGPTDWSSDGRYVLAQDPDNDGHRIGLQLLPMDGDEQPSSFLRSAFNEGKARISPNGKWVAYVSNESGKLEVYVQSFPIPGSKQRISGDGGSWPRWRGDGKELFYVANRTIMSVSVQSDDRFSASAPKPLFHAPAIGLNGDLGVVDPFEVSLDGQRFLVLPRLQSTSISLIVNWPSQLKQ